MAGQGEESPADQSRPKRVRSPEVGSEIEDPQFARVLRHLMNGWPTARCEMQDRGQTYKRSADVDHGLHYIGPDPRRQTAFEGVDERERGDDCDGGDLARA